MTDDSTETFVQEVDQNLRDEKMIADAKRYAPYAIGVVVLLLVAIGGWQGWQAYQTNEARKGAQDFSAAQQLAGSGDMNGAKAKFLALTTSGPQTYRVMARLEYAAVLQAQGDPNGALAQFDKAATETNDPLMRETAQLRAAYIAADTQDYDAINRRLQPLLKSHTRLSYLAQELLALEAWKAGKTDVARDTLQNLALAFSAPESVRDRAQRYLGVIGPAPAQPATNTSPTAPAPAQGAHP